MKRINLLTWLILALMVMPVSAANQWRNGNAEETILGSESVNDIDTVLFQRVVDPIDRMLADYRGQTIRFNSTSQLTVTAGGVSCTNAGNTINTFRYNPSATTISWSDIDTGGETNATHYIYAVADSDLETNTYLISLSSTAPNGATSYKRLGSFLNSGGDITEADIQNDDDGNYHTSVGTGWGTIANGGTISVPSGFAQANCSWTVALGSGAVSGSHPDGVSYISTVNSSRVATCTFAAIGAGSDGTTTCNYIIVCQK